LLGIFQVQCIFDALASAEGEKVKDKVRPVVYILECADGTLYTGWTTDLEARLRTHNEGKGGRYTRSRRPLRLLYREEHPSRASAQSREWEIKSWDRARKLKLIASAEEDKIS
jgi:putative endonuclease